MFLLRSSLLLPSSIDPLRRPPWSISKITMSLVVGTLSNRIRLSVVNRQLFVVCWLGTTLDGQTDCVKKNRIRLFVNPSAVRWLHPHAPCTAIIFRCMYSKYETARRQSARPMPHRQLREKIQRKQYKNETKLWNWNSPSEAAVAVTAVADVAGMHADDNDESCRRPDSIGERHHYC